MHGDEERTVRRGEVGAVENKESICKSSFLLQNTQLGSQYPCYDPLSFITLSGLFRMKAITCFLLNSFPSTLLQCKFSIKQSFLYLRFYFKDFISCRRDFLPAHDFHWDAWRGCIYSFAILIKHETHLCPGLPCNQNTALSQSSSLDDGCGKWTGEEQRRKITDKI